MPRIIGPWFDNLSTADMSAYSRPFQLGWFGPEDAVIDVSAV